MWNSLYGIYVMLSKVSLSHNAIHCFFFLILTKMIFGISLLQLVVVLLLISSASSRSQVCWYAIIICAVIQPHNHDSSRTNSMREFIWRRQSFRAFRAVCLPAIITAIVHKKEYVITQVCVHVLHVEEKKKSKEKGEKKYNLGMNVECKQTDRKTDQIWPSMQWKTTPTTISTKKKKKKPATLHCPPADRLSPSVYTLTSLFVH